MCEFHDSNGNGLGDMWWTDKYFYFSIMYRLMISVEAHHGGMWYIVTLIWGKLSHGLQIG